MSTRTLLLAALAGAASAAFHLAVGLGSFGALILAYLSQLPLFAAGLSAGLPAALAASAVGLAIVAAALPLAVAGLFAVGAALPVLVLTGRALLSRRDAAGNTVWYPAGHLVAALNGIALAYLAAAALYFSGRDGGLAAAGREFLAEALRGFAGTAGVADLPAGAMDDSLVAGLLPALILTSWQFMVAVNGLLAQGALTRFGANLRPGEPFARLDLPSWPVFALAAAAAAALLPGQIGDFGRNAALVVLMPFFFLGLSVIHAVSTRWPGRGVLLAGTYLILLLAGWPALVVAAVGVFEPWMRLRERLAPPPGGSGGGARG